MIGFLLAVVAEIWSILEEASLFLLIGFLLAGVLAVLVPGEALRRRLGRGRVRSVLWGSAIGAPLPLCSCGVLPTALALRRRGATDGATVAFLVATPETGIDSLVLSYSLADPLFALFRPVAGVLSAIAAGLATNLLAAMVRPESRGIEAAALAEPATQAVSCEHDADGACGRDHDHVHTLDDSHDCGHSHGLASDAEVGATSIWTARGAARAGVRVLRYAFDEMLDETGYWLVAGFVLSGFIIAALPNDFAQRVLGGGIASMLAMVLVAVPIYTCASSSTPVAASLVLKGLSPGAALVFLLTGPATNIGSLVVLIRFLGARVVAVYLAATIGMAVGAGLLLDAIYQRWAIDPYMSFGVGGELVPRPLKIAGAVVFLALLVRSLRRTPLPVEWRWLNDCLAAATGFRLTARRSAAAAASLALLLYIGSGLFTVRPGQSGLIVRFGAPVATDLAPGLHFRLPWPIDADRVVDRDAIRRLAFGLDDAAPSEARQHRPPRQSEMFGTPPPLASGGVVFRKDNTPPGTYFLTGDSNVIDLRFTIHWRVADATRFATAIEAAEPLIQSLALAGLRGATAASGIDAIYTTAREAIERQVAQSVQGELDRYGAGIAIVATHILYDHPPDEVHDSFRDVASAQEDKLRTINRAQTFAIEKVNHSRGDARAMIEAAEGFRDERILRSEGEAAAFRTRLDAYRAAPDLARFRLRMEAAEAALAGAPKLIAPTKPARGPAGLQARQPTDAPAPGAIDLWLNQPFSASGKR